MLLLLFLIIQVHLGDFKCDICITQPLWTSPQVSKCPICTIDGKKHVLENCDSDLCEKPFLDNRNPNNWTTCNIEKPVCDSSYKYRSYDGSCNNLDHPTWGMAKTAFTRIIPGNYRDGIHLVRLSKLGRPLPLARVLTTKVFTSGDTADLVSFAAGIWGQIVAHDMLQSKPVAEFWDCCESVLQNERLCLRLDYPDDDYFFSQFNVTCHNMRRRKYSHVGKDCTHGSAPAQQVNYNSHPLDGSVIYGSDIAKADSLRSFSKGLLKFRKLKDGRDFLPNLPFEEANNICKQETTAEPCYTAGDFRVNSNTGLTSLQVLFLRAHNNIAQKLGELHPKWQDEKLFQETRRIVVAILQHITYKEWLPLYIGSELVQKYKLFPSPSGYIKYNRNINLNSINSFAAAAFRIGHSSIRDYFKMYDKNHQLSGGVTLNDYLDRPVVIERGTNYDQFVLGLVNHPMQLLDNIFTPQYSNMYSHGKKPYGRDMVSTDIIRGRDNGISPYISYLEVLYGYKVKSFEQLHLFIQPVHVSALKRIYTSVEDIDLLVGGTLERHVYSSRLGPTFLFIIAEQFYRLKYGDRFFYEVEAQLGSFTPVQLQEIKKMTLSKLICDNSDEIEYMPADSFKPASRSNQVLSCHKIPGIDLEYF